MVAANKLQWMRQRLFDFATPNDEWWAYVHQHNLDLKAVLPECGIFAVALCRAIETADGQYVFAFDPGGIPCAVIEGQLIGNVEGVLDYITKDLIAWPLGAPDHFATAMGPGDGIALLGAAAAFREPSVKTPIKLCRNPESWLLNGCKGSVVLKPEAAQWLNVSKVPLICEDGEHAQQIRELLGSVGRLRKILIPNSERIAA